MLISLHKQATTTPKIRVAIQANWEPALVVAGLKRHLTKGFLKFLRQIDKTVPTPRNVHLVLDKYAIHKSPEVKAELDKHPRFKLHFTPPARLG